MRTLGRYERGRACRNDLIFCLVACGLMTGVLFLLYLCCRVLFDQFM